MTREKITREEMARTCEAYGETMPNWYGLALEAAAAELRKMNWQPIATAPKDGTEVLVWREGRLFHAKWGGSFHNTWIAATGIGFYDHATHWMPLPLPPANTEAVTP